MLSFARLRLLTAGESHGPALVGILEGAPAGFPIEAEKINEALKRRQKAIGSGGRMNIETDKVKINSGVCAGKSTGGPIAIEIPNLDHENWCDKEIEPMTVPRPGHADLTGATKYNHRDLRLSLERASARETAVRVALGAILKQMLEQFGIKVGGYVQSMGNVSTQSDVSADAELYRKKIDIAEKSTLSSPDAKIEKAMLQAIEETAAKGDTLGGVFEIVALNVPPGLGSYAQGDRRLEANLASAMMGIQAVKGVEIGPAFENATMLGRAVQDEILLDEKGQLTRNTNRAGGIEGGITTSEPIVIRAAMKPIATTINPTKSVDLVSMESKDIKYERSDICPLPRAVVVGETVIATVLADALFEKLGGDSLEEMQPRFKELNLGKRGEFNLDNKPWKFDYQA